MKRYFLLLVAAVLLLFPQSGLATPTPVTLEFIGVSPPQVVNISGVGGVYAGVYKLLLDGSPIDSFCVELDQFAPHTPAAYEMLPIPDSLKPAAWIFGNFDFVSPVSSQAAIWKNQGATINPWSGSGSLAEALAIEASIPSDLSGFDFSGFAWLHSEWKQDYIIQTPEPTGLLLLGLGLVSICTLRRKETGEI